MSTKQLSDLPAATSVNDDDLLLKRDDGSGTDQKLSIQTLIDEAFGSAATEEVAVNATPDTVAKRDGIGRLQSAAGGTGAAVVVHNDTSEDADADTVAKRDASGRLKTADGGSGTDAVNHNDIDELDFVPAGAVMYFAMDSAPDGWLKANGAEVSRSTYSDLFDAIGTTFGSGDGSTTFELPDLRGEFIRGWDDGRGVDSGRSFGSFQEDEFESHNHSGSQALRGNGQDERNSVPSASDNVDPGRTWNFTVDNTGGDETRPRNVACLACIKF